MAMAFLAFSRPSRAGDAWFCAGQASTYPNITDDARISEHRRCKDGQLLTGCRVFLVPPEDSSLASEVALDDWKDPEAGGEARNQVMVLQYKGKFVAVNHECPHSSYPLSSGRSFDIEDFGIMLSAGITCPKHDWSFDMYTGQSDRGTYRLKVWEVQLRPAPSDANVMEVWVRRKQRIG